MFCPMRISRYQYQYVPKQLHTLSFYDDKLDHRWTLQIPRAPLPTEVPSRKSNLHWVIFIDPSYNIIRLFSFNPMQRTTFRYIKVWRNTNTSLRQSFPLYDHLQLAYQDELIYSITKTGIAHYLRATLPQQSASSFSPPLLAQCFPL